jgi:hypothetical protein
VGFGFALDEAQVALYPDLIVYATLYLLTLVLVARARIAEAWYVHAFIAIHFIAMVIFTPYDYENRLVLPMFVPMLCFVALGVVSVVEALAKLRSASPTLAGPRMQTEVGDGG